MNDIDFIEKACELVSFDSIYPDWILFNTKEAHNPETTRPSYIKVYNKYGSSWRPMKQDNYDKMTEDDIISYSNGSNIYMIMDEEGKLLCDGFRKFELFYEEITREEYIKSYKDMAYRTLKEKNLLNEIK